MRRLFVRASMCSVVIAALASGCGHSAQFLGPSASDPLEQNAKQVLAKHCGSCHLGSVPTAPKLALEVFDLERESWAAQLSQEQIEGARIRIDSPTVNGEPTKITDAERSVVVRFLRSQMRRRVEATSVPLNWRIALTDQG